MKGMTIQDLVAHMKKHKDALVIMGPGAIKDLELPAPTSEEISSCYNHKVLVRTPDKFWDFFEKYIYVDVTSSAKTKAQKNIVSLHDLGVISTVVSLTTDGLIATSNDINSDIIQLHGSCQTITCPSCKTLYPTIAYVNDGKLSIMECEQCGKPLRPNVLLVGNTYDQDNYDAMKHLIAETHTLILVGIDYSEDPVIDMIIDYGDKKDVINAIDPENKKIVIAIQEKDEDFNPNDLALCEFIVKDDCGEATERLLSAFNG